MTNRTLLLDTAVIRKEILPDDTLYRFIQIRFQLLDGFGLIVENGIIARSADEFDDHIDHDLRIVEVQPGSFQQLTVIFVDVFLTILRSIDQGVFEKCPA